MYVYGSAAPKREILPDDTPRHTRRKHASVSRQVRQNRRHAQNISTSYAVFLTGAAVFAVWICVLCLQLQSEVVSRSENITELQRDLADLTEDNDTVSQAAEDSVNLEAVRDRAVNGLGMVYEDQGSVVEYDNPEMDTVIQHSEIPEDGVLAKSKSVSE